MDAETKKEITFKEILDKSRKLSEGLIAKGVTYGDVVAICSENNLEYCWIVLGVLRAHASCALLSPTYTTSRFRCYIMGTVCNCKAGCLKLEVSMSNKEFCFILFSHCYHHTKEVAKIHAILSTTLFLVCI